MVYLRKTELSQLHRKKKQHKQRVKSPRIKKLSSTKKMAIAKKKKKKEIKNRKQTLCRYDNI